MKNITNWFGIPSHPTDEYIHWGDRKPEKTAEKLRKAYDAIKDAGLINELKTLTEAAYELAQSDAAEIAAGEDL